MTAANRENCSNFLSGPDGQALIEWVRSGCPSITPEQRKGIESYSIASAEHQGYHLAMRRMVTLTDAKTTKIDKKDYIQS